jgi:hypothetical protein
MSFRQECHFLTFNSQYKNGESQQSLMISGVAAERYAEQIDLVMAQTGWEVVYHPQVNQQALSMAVLDVLPPGARISKGPSYFMDRREVQVG